MTRTKAIYGKTLLHGYIYKPFQDFEVSSSLLMLLIGTALYLSSLHTGRYQGHPLFYSSPPKIHTYNKL